ncbi:MAG: hypothetical protein AB7F86_18440 [Bdellovibrionales bacterium]
MNKDTVASVFVSRAEVTEALGHLHKLGISERDIQVFYPRRRWSLALHSNQKTKVKSGAQIGAIVGVTIGSLLAAMVYLSGGLPGYEAGSSWMLIGMCVGLFVLFTLYGAGGGSLIGIGVPEPAAQRFAQYLRDGGIVMLIKVKDAESFEKVRAAVDDAGGEDIVGVHDNKEFGVPAAR